MVHSYIEQAAACLRCGNHNGAAAALRELEVGEGAQTLQTAVQCLTDKRGSRDDVYVLFVALKVVVYALTRCRRSRRQQSGTAVAFLLGYAYEMTEQAEAHVWTPVVSELATAVAVALKLGCVGDNLDVCAAEVTAVCSGLVELTQNCTSSPRAYVHRITCQSVVEEFGLFTGASRYRGLPVRVHRRCRELFAAEGRLPTLIQALLRSLLESAGESSMSVDKALSALVSCFAWPSHQFFEEDAATEESCSVFHVAHSEWDRLLVGDMALQSGACVSLHGLLRDWYGSGTVNGVPIDRRKVIEVIQLLCAFKGIEWTAVQAQRFLVASLSLCVDVFEHLSQWATEGDLQLFPLLANAVVRLVSNYVEVFFDPQAHTLVSRLTTLTCFLIRRDTSSNTDTDVMSCVDEMLSVWFHLTSYMDRSSFSANGSETIKQRHLISEGCQCIFSTYLDVQVGTDAVELEEDCFVDTFTNSHLHLVAQIGRVCAVHTCELLIRSLQSLRDTLATILSAGGAVPSSLFEAIWTLLKIIGFFIADPVEGEQPYIPRCFLEMGLQGCPSLLHLMREVDALLPLLQNPLAASPAVQAAFLDILSHYIKTYVEAEESCALYAAAFNGGAEMVARSLLAVVGALSIVPFEEESTSAACRLLDCVADKSVRVRSFCLSQEPFQRLTQAAQEIVRFRFYGHTRGRLIAFVLACCPDVGSVQAQLRECRLSLSSEDDVNFVLELLSSLAGLFESLHCQHVIRCVFPALLTTGRQLIAVSVSKFYEREIAVESVQCVRSVFVTCSPLLEDSGIRALLDLVLAELRYVVRALETSSAWRSDDDESDKVEFILSVARFLCSLAQWKALDCFLSEEDTRDVSIAAVEAAGALLHHMDERSLSLPHLEDAIFSCIELCAESFTSDFVHARCSDAFLSAMLYALNSERIHIQRAGVAITSSVAAFLEGSARPATHASACSDLLKVLLRALMSGKVFFNNLRQISRVLLLLVRVMPQDSLVEALEVLARDAPGCNAFLTDIFPLLQSVACHTSACESGFEELLQDAVSSVHGTSIIGA
ncbi:hypothetical protein LSCM1_00010 [Leishmania martiniquensis]|uniref:Uncharacterized protein n=1 Tax=Leishmania martiniquensis TaxID=1580590 RepID=A0A836G1Z8_9TRYP|nr:hypothetical protein LSCM1_00010 [Leishmania martiniquensis]